MLLCVEESLLFIIHHLLTYSLPQDSWFVITFRTVVLSRPGLLRSCLLLAPSDGPASGPLHWLIPPDAFLTGHLRVTPSDPLFPYHSLITAVSAGCFQPERIN